MTDTPERRITRTVDIHVPALTLTAVPIVLICARRRPCHHALAAQIGGYLRTPTRQWKSRSVARFGPERAIGPRQARPPDSAIRAGQPPNLGLSRYHGPRRRRRQPMTFPRALARYTRGAVN